MTLSKVALASAAVVWLLAASPTITLEAIENVSLPTLVHDDPVLDTCAVMVLAVRTSLTHRGAVPLPPDVCSDVAPVERRR